MNSHPRDARVSTTTDLGPILSGNLGLGMWRSQSWPCPQHKTSGAASNKNQLLSLMALSYGLHNFSWGLEWQSQRSHYDREGQTYIRVGHFDSQALRLLGHHTDPTFKSALTYGRDSLSGAHMQA